MIPIRVYYHTTLINHHIEIIQYIFSKMVDSGLYERCEAIIIGALGDKDELQKLEQFLSKYPKAKIGAHSERKDDWEFHTLRLLKKDADILPKFYALYTHAKSVTFKKEGTPNVEGRTPDAHKFDWYWMQYMTHFLVGDWERWYKALDMKYWGYDVAGVRVVPARCSASTRTHASGTFTAANSEYVKTLSNKTIVWEETKDKFEAEQWLWSGNPITYVMCNMFCEGFPFEIPFDEYMASFPNLEEYISP